MAMKDYNNGKIYCIRNNIDDDICVGSATQPLSKRMTAHRATANKRKRGNSMLYIKMRHMGPNKFYIELIKECPRDNLEQLRRTEGELSRQMAALNQNVAGQTKAEYREIHRDEIDKQKREYLIRNKEE